MLVNISDNIETNNDTTVSLSPGLGDITTVENYLTNTDFNLDPLDQHDPLDVIFDTNTILPAHVSTLIDLLYDGKKDGISHNQHNKQINIFNGYLQRIDEEH